MGYENVDKLNKLLAGRQFHVCGPIFQDFVYLDECLDFNIEVLEIRDSRVRVKINVLKNVTDEQSEKFWEILSDLGRPAQDFRTHKKRNLLTKFNTRTIVEKQ